MMEQLGTLKQKFLPKFFFQLIVTKKIYSPEKKYFFFKQKTFLRILERIDHLSTFMFS